MPPTSAATVVHAIFVHHAGREMLEVALSSLLESTAGVDAPSLDLQAVVIQNGCDDDEIPSLAREHERAHIVRSLENRGFSEANNLGVEWARIHLGAADWYYFVNNDTRSEPDALAAMLRALADAPRVAMAGPTLRILGAPDHLNSLGLNVTDDAWGWDEGIGIALDDYGPLPSAPRPVLAVTGSALLLRADVFVAIGGWTELYGWYFEDIDLGIKVWKAGYEVLHVPDAVVYHQISATMTVGAERKFFFFQRNRLYLALLHWPADLLRRLWDHVRLEIRLGEEPDKSRRQKALRATLLRLPWLLWWRWRLRGDTAWRRFLYPRGSVPVITLPHVGDEPEPTPEPATEPAPEDVDGGIAPSGLAAPEPPPLAALDEVVEALRELAASSADGVDGGDHDGNEATAHTAHRLAVVGWGPLPDEPARLHLAPAHRTAHLAVPLAASRAPVLVVEAAIPGSVDEDVTDAHLQHRADGLVVLRLPSHYFEDTAVEDSHGVLRRCLDAFDPVAVVGVAPVPARLACRAAGDRPLWIDLFGDPMSEAQARAVALEVDRDVYSAYTVLLLELLERGDCFSAVSARQRHAVLGQLGLAGRLVRATADEELVHVIPCAAVAEEPEAEVPEADENLVEAVQTEHARAKKSRNEDARAENARAEDEEAESSATEDEYEEEPAEVKLDERSEQDQTANEPPYLLWTGSFNTWCDVDTLADALEQAMERHASLRFIATGAALSGHDESTFERLRARLDDSPYGDRVDFLGGGSRERLARLSADAALLVVTERRLVERELGSSGRVAEWLARGVPFVCTRQSELGEIVEREELGWTYPIGDADALAAVFERAAARDPALGDRAARARSWAHEHLDPAATTRALQAWAAAPHRAADRRDGPPSSQGLAAVARQADQRALEADARYHATRAELGAIHQSRMWKLWTGWHDLRSALRRLLPF
ncbi:MAG: glycosyltransferase [Acidobacteriota bacterium]